MSAAEQLRAAAAAEQLRAAAAAEQLIDAVLSVAGCLILSDHLSTLSDDELLHRWWRTGTVIQYTTF